MLLKYQSGPIKFYELLEAMLRLNIEEPLHSLVREKITSGNFSRDAYDISIALSYFGRVLKRGNKKDLDVFKIILRDIKFMEIHHLRSQHLEYLLEGLKAGLPYLEDAEIQLIKETMPSIIENIDKDLHRYKFRNLINLQMSFSKIHKGES